MRKYGKWVKKGLVLSGYSYLFVNLLCFAKRFQNTDYCVSLTQDSNMSKVSLVNFIEKIAAK